MSRITFVNGQYLEYSNSKLILKIEAINLGMVFMKFFQFLILILLIMSRILTDYFDH